MIFDHGFGLRKIDAPVEEGPSCKFAGLGEPRPGGEHKLEDPVEDRVTAVAVDLHHVSRV